MTPLKCNFLTAIVSCRSEINYLMKYKHNILLKIHVYYTIVINFYKESIKSFMTIEYI